jgi:FkbM family methyltransferase
MIKQTDTRYRKDFYYYANDLYIGKSLELYGEYQQSEIDLLLKLINSNCIVYDVGANIGYHTNAFATVAKKVIAFEPNPKNFSLFAKNVEGLSNVYGLQAAVGEKSGVLKCSDFDPSKEGNFGNVLVREEGDIEVPVLSLDEYQDLPWPDLIKIDVEGMEYQVMMGMKNIITQRTPALYYEAHETKELPEIYDFLSSLEYNLYWTCVPNYVKTNFKNNSNNIFEDTILVSILAWPKNHGAIPLPIVLDRYDNHTKLLARNKK